MTVVNPPPRPQLVDGVDVDAVAAAVRGGAGVEDLATGALGSVATYLPGRTVAGVAVAQDHMTVQLRSRWGVSTGTVAGQVRSAVAALVGLRRVDIVVADIADPVDIAPGDGDPGSGQRAAPSSVPSIVPPVTTMPGS